MRKKVRKSLAFLLALALVVSVMSGLGLSVSADDAQNEPVVTETEGEPAEEKLKAEESTPKEGEKEEEAEPDAEAVPEEKKDVKKAEGEGSGEKAAENKAAETPKAGENVQTATIGTGDKTVTVKTTAAAGVLPEGAKLVVKKLANQDQAYQDAESTLKDSQVTYDDFLALDVGFEVNGKEVEPEAGSVQVQFELGAGLLPETADTSTLAVQHLTDGKAEMVADAGAVTAGDVTVEKEGVKADFAVQSFSSFTITWSDCIEVTVFYVDEYGNDIPATQGNVTINDNNMGTINLQQYAQTIPGYTYKNARYKSYNGDVITDLNSSMKTEHTWWGPPYSVREIQFLNTGETVATVSNSDWDRDTTNATIYLVYGEDENSGGGTGGVVTKPTPSYSKQANLRDDGTYDLSLTVSSNIGSASNPAKVDVIYVLDVSGSMDEWIGDQRKRNAANNAISSMTNSLANDKLINARFSLVTFSGSGNDGKYNDADNPVLWTSNAGTLNNSLPKSSNGGTNYEAGLIKAKELLESARKGATTVVIFVSDGNPGYYYNTQGYTAGTPNPGNSYDNTAMSRAQDQVKKLAATYFFKVGVGKDANAYQYLKLITGDNNPTYDNKLHDGTKTKPVFEGTDTKTLNAAFEEMRGAITSISCTEVNITDTLQSNHAQIVKDANGSPTALRIVVTDGDGKEVKSGEGSVTLTATTNNKAEVSTINAEYDDISKQIKLNFNPDYQLEENWTYAVIANIEPTAQAYEYYCNNKDYPDGEIGDAATGTHARESGFYCNTNAVLSYNDGESGKTAIYAKPVIQVKPGTLKITKRISGLSNDQIADAKLSDKLTFKIAKGTDSQEVKLSEFKPGTDGTYTYEMPYCVPGATYTVTESGMAVEGFDCATKVDGTTQVTGSATIEKGETETIAFTNVYTPSTQDLTITKEIWVDGNKYEGAEFNDAEYTFTVSGEKLTEARTVTVKGAESKTIEGLPVGSYTITETNRTNEPAKYEFKETDRPQEITLSKENHAVTITNKYETKKYKVYVRKELDGNMYNSSDKFDFNVTGKTETLQLGKDETSSAYEVTYGDSFTVKETNDKGYTSTTAKAYKATVRNGTVSAGEEVNGTYKDADKSYTLSNITEDIIIVYTNTKTIQPPNGIITTIAPYAIMVVLAAGAGVYFVYSRRRRNG